MSTNTAFIIGQTPLGLPSGPRSSSILSTTTHFSPFPHFATKQPPQQRTKPTSSPSVLWSSLKCTATNAHTTFPKIDPKTAPPPSKPSNLARLGKTKDRVFDDTQHIFLVSGNPFEDVNNSAEWLKKIGLTGERIVIVADEYAWQLYGKQVSRWVEAAGKSLVIHTLQAGEQNKTLEKAMEVVEFLDKACVLRRSEPVLMFGGGVINDVVGFACSTWRRGVPWVRIPTTLLAMVDASVGIKVGVNLFLKNGVGAFHSPRATLIIPELMKTQKILDLRPAIGEMVKAGIIHDDRILPLLLRCPPLKSGDFPNAEVMTELMQDCIEAMLECIGPDLREEQLKRPMDFGHTLSRWFETEEGFQMAHGDAVALDSFITTYIARHMKLVDEAFVKKVEEVYAHHSLPAFHQSLKESLIDLSIEKVVIHRDGHLQAPLPSLKEKVIYADEFPKDAIKYAVDRARKFIKEHPNCLYEDFQA